MLAVFGPDPPTVLHTSIALRLRGVAMMSENSQCKVSGHGNMLSHAACLLMPWKEARRC